MPFERVSALETDVKYLRSLVEERHDLLQERIMRLEASHENIERTLYDIAGLIRDQGTERRVVERIGRWVFHFVGWAIALFLGWYSRRYFLL